MRRVFILISAFTTTNLLIAQTVGIGSSSFTPGSMLSVDGSLSVGNGYRTTVAPTNGAIIQGNVGIGTSNPNYAIDITSAGTTNTQLRFGSANGDNGGFLVSTSASQSIITGGAAWDGTNWRAKATTSSQTEYSGGNINFYTNAALTIGNTFTPSNRMTILSDGNVGIGSTSPGFLLDVYGAAGAISRVKCGAGAGGAIHYMDRATTSGYNGHYLLTAGVADWAVGTGMAYVNNDYNFYNYGTASINMVVKKANGYVGIGTHIPGYILTVNGEPAANGYTAFTNYSDRRLKKNITPVENSLDKIMKLNPVQYNYNEEYLRLYNDSLSQERLYKGFIAQEVKEIFPEMVGIKQINEKEYYDLNLSNLPVYLVKAMQEQQQKINVLEQEIIKLKK